MFSDCTETNTSSHRSPKTDRQGRKPKSADELPDSQLDSRSVSRPAGKTRGQSDRHLLCCRAVSVDCSSGLAREAAAEQMCPEPGMMLNK